MQARRVILHWSSHYKSALRFPGSRVYLISKANKLHRTKIKVARLTQVDNFCEIGAEIRMEPQHIVIRGDFFAAHLSPNVTRTNGLATSTRNSKAL